MENENIPPTVPALVIAVLLMAVVVNKASDEIRYKSDAIDSLQTELRQYKQTYQYREGIIHDETARPETVRVVTIDGGRNWILVTATREVKNQRYLHIAYPNVNPDSLERIP